MPPHSSSIYVVADTMEAHAGCEVIKACRGAFVAFGSATRHETTRKMSKTIESAWKHGWKWASERQSCCEDQFSLCFSGNELLG